MSALRCLWSLRALGSLFRSISLGGKGGRCLFSRAVGPRPRVGFFWALVPLFLGAGGGCLLGRRHLSGPFGFSFPFGSAPVLLFSGRVSPRPSVRSGGARSFGESQAGVLDLRWIGMGFVCVWGVVLISFPERRVLGDSTVWSSASWDFLVDPRSDLAPEEVLSELSPAPPIWHDSVVVSRGRTV